MQIFIKTLQGLEPYLKKEVETIGGLEVRIGNRSVSCEGDLEFIYKANYLLRTALRVLINILSFKAKSESDLYKEIKKFDWSSYLTLSQTFAIDHTVFSDYIKHSKFASLKMKDAIVDQFRDKVGSRPNVDTKSPDVRFNLHGYGDTFHVSVDSSGESLNKRGYRGVGHEAPLNEVLAAGMLKIAGWNPNITLIDPMCGTGTILIEAGMIAQNIPPQFLRRDFGFKTWKNFNPGLWYRVKSEADSKIKKSRFNIRGGDIDSKAARTASQSLRKLGLDKEIEVRKSSFENQHPSGQGMMITNPPYGERIGKDVEHLYQKLGDTLKNRFSGYDAWILSSNMRALKQLRLKPSERINLYNGALECQYCKYEMYQGARSS